MTTLNHVCLCQSVFMPRGKNFSRNTYHVGDFRLYMVNRKFILRKKMHVSFSLSLELAGIENKVQAGMFVSQIFKSVCTSEQSDQSLSFPSHFLPIYSPSKSDQTVWMGTHVNLYLFMDTGSNIIHVVGF